MSFSTKLPKPSGKAAINHVQFLLYNPKCGHQYYFSSNWRLFSPLKQPSLITSNRRWPRLDIDSGQMINYRPLSFAPAYSKVIVSVLLILQD